MLVERDVPAAGLVVKLYHVSPFLNNKRSPLKRFTIIQVRSPPLRREPRTHSKNERISIKREAQINAIKFRKGRESCNLGNQERFRTENRFCWVIFIPDTGNCVQRFRDGDAYGAGAGPGWPEERKSFPKTAKQILVKNE